MGMAKICKQTMFWTTENHQKIRICDLTDVHLLNVLKMLKRNAIQRQEDESESAWATAFTVSGDMASYYAEQAADEVSSANWSDYVSEFWKPMLLDAERRGGETRQQASLIGEPA